MKLEPVYVWVVGTVKQAMAKLSRSLTPLHIGTPRQNQGDKAGNGSGLPAGKVAWPVDPSTHDDAVFVAADVFFAEYDADKGEVWMLDDIDGTRHPGGLALKRGFNVEILNGVKRSGKGVVYRTAEYGSEGIAKNIFQHVAPDIIAHHRKPRQPQNSTMVRDPGEGNDDWEGGLHYPLRVRRWLIEFCSGQTTTSDGKPLFAPLFNMGTNGDGTPAHGAAHFDKCEATLSESGGGPLDAANDGNHRLGRTLDAEVNQGALDIDALYGPVSGLYGPEEIINQQWEQGAKGPYPVRVEKRPDFNARHLNHCGKPAPLVIKWQSFKDTTIYEPPPKEPPPKDPVTGPPLKVPPGGPQTPAMQKVVAPLPRPGTTSPGQIETPSVQGHAEPALPDGPMTGRSSKSPHEQAWLNRYGWTEVEFVKQPLGADLVAVPEYQSATPNNNATGAARWEPKYSQEAVFTADKDGRVTSRDQIATGSGDFVVMPARSNPKHIFVENKGSIEAGEDVSGLFVLAVNNGTNGIAGWFGLGSRLITGGLASGWKAELDFSSSATEPHINWTKRDASGANAGAGEFRINGTAIGSGSGDISSGSNLTNGRVVKATGNKQIDTPVDLNLGYVTVDAADDTAQLLAGPGKNIQLSSPSKIFLNVNGTNEITVEAGVVTIDDLLVADGVELNPVAANPGGTAANTLWLDSGGSNLLKHGAQLVGIIHDAPTNGNLMQWKGSNSRLEDSGIAASAVITGSTGSTDNAILRANGTGGSAAQSSSATIDDSGNIFIAGTTTAGVHKYGDQVDTVSAVGSPYSDYTTPSARMWLVNSSATFNSFAAVADKIFTLVNSGSSTITIKHETGSTAANRVWSPTGADYAIAQYQSATFWYDTTNSRWRIISGTGT